jgi:hypothetical protein
MSVVCLDITNHPSAIAIGGIFTQYKTLQTLSAYVGCDSVAPLRKALRFHNELAPRNNYTRLDDYVKSLSSFPHFTAVSYGRLICDCIPLVYGGSAKVTKTKIYGLINSACDVFFFARLVKSVPRILVAPD